LRNERLFKLACTHRSATPGAVVDSYERLEFFGDSVLGLIVAQYLYEHHPAWDQGMLSKAKSSVVQEAPLAQVAKRLGLDEFIIVSASEEATGGKTRPSILADVFEAVIGAVYLESGLEVTRWFVLEQLHDFLARISSGNVNPDDYKSRLQELGQSIWRKVPSYRVVRELGNSHNREFVVEVMFDDEVMGEGAGRSKKEAEQAAAAEAIAIIERAQRAKELSQY
jgi:ribonuclease III